MKDSMSYRGIRLVLNGLGSSQDTQAQLEVKNAIP
jgi:hypothetical protein